LNPRALGLRTPRLPVYHHINLAGAMRRCALSSQPTLSEGTGTWTGSNSTHYACCRRKLWLAGVARLTWPQLSSQGHFFVCADCVFEGRFTRGLRLSTGGCALQPRVESSGSLVLLLPATVFLLTGYGSTLQNSLALPPARSQRLETAFRSPATTVPLREPPRRGQRSWPTSSTKF
jgi:hypothetical protein